MLLTEFEGKKKAIIEPSEIIRRDPDFPRVGVSCFSLPLLNRFAKKMNGKQITWLINVSGKVPVYKIVYNEIPVMLMPAAVGGPACAAAFEEVIAKGLEVLVQVGSCGVLDDFLESGQLILPVSALRDEGTSFHYMEPSDEIPVSTDGLNVLTQVVEDNGFTYVKGKTWTTDAVYRETPEKIQRRKEVGCIAVEMECASMLAVAAYRKVLFLPLLFAADSVASQEWKSRDLGDPRLMEDEKILYLAVKCASEL